MTNLTQNESKVLKTILTNDFTMSNGAIPATYEGTDWIWSDCINDSASPSGIEGKSLSGVVSSLCKKGLVVVDGISRDACVSLTEAGFAAAAKMGG